MTPLSLKTIAQEVQAQFSGSGDMMIHGVNSLAAAQPGELSFVQSSRYLKELNTTQASAVLIKEAWVDKSLNIQWLIVPNPRLAFTVIAKHFVTQDPLLPGIHPTAVIGENCQIHSSVVIGPYVVVEAGVRIGANTVIHAHSYLGKESEVGADSVFYPRVNLYAASKVGERAILHSGVVIGADGFGFERDAQGWSKFPQLGKVVIGNDVEIGANSTIDCGALEDTIIGDGVKIDNQVQIGHNVQIGNQVLICGKVGIAGSAKIGDNCILGGNVMIADNVVLSPGVILTGFTAAPQSIDKPGIYGSSLSALPHMRWKKNMKRFAELDELAQRLRKLEKQLATLDDQHCN